MIQMAFPSTQISVRRQLRRQLPGNIFQVKPDQGFTRRIARFHVPPPAVVIGIHQFQEAAPVDRLWLTHERVDLIFRVLKGRNDRLIILSGPPIIPDSQSPVQVQNPLRERLELWLGDVHAGRRREEIVLERCAEN